MKVQEVQEFQELHMPRPGGVRVRVVWHRKFSNFARSRILSPTGLEVATAEALYQAAKVPGDRELQRAILQTVDPKEAKQLARRHERRLEPRWKRHWQVFLRLEVMEWVLRRKFAQNPDLAGLLVATEDAPIVEPSRFDTFWGMVTDSPWRWRGENRLGRLLMELRAELQKTGSLRVPAPPVPVL